MTTPYWDYSDSEEEISTYSEEEKFWEARKRGYLKAISDVEEGMHPIEALTKMWHTVIEWQDEPLEDVLSTILGEGLKPQERAYRRIWQISKEHENKQRIKPKKRKLQDKPILPSKPLPFVTTELEEDFDIEEDDQEEPETPSRRYEERELIEEVEEEEDGEEDDSWLQRAKERAAQPEIEDVDEWEEKKPVKRTRKTRRPTFSSPQSTSKIEPVKPRTVIRPTIAQEEYRLWTFDGIKFTPLIVDSDWIGSTNLEEGKRLAEKYNAKLLPKILITKEFNLWERDNATGAIVPITYEHKNTLIHLGQDREELAQKMVAAMKKQFNIEAIALPKTQEVFEGFDLNYFNNFA